MWASDSVGRPLLRGGVHHPAFPFSLLNGGGIRIVTAEDVEKTLTPEVTVRPLHLRRLMFVLAYLSLGVAAAPSAAQERTDDPVSVFQGFLAAVEGADALGDVSGYLPAELRAMIDEVPEEQQVAFFETLKEQSREAPAGAWEVVERAVADDSAELVLVGTIEREGMAIRRRTRVHLLLEADGWKVESADPWSTIAMMPAVLTPDTELEPPGPGAEGGVSLTYDVATYVPAAGAAGAADSWEGSIEFDPQGHLVAVTNGRSGEIRLLELDGLREAGSVQTDSRGFAFTHAISFRWDGRALATLGASGSVPEVLPLAANLGGMRPDGGYFFSRPIFTEAAASVPGPPKWAGLAYHPTEPVLALGLGDRDDETTGAILVQPTGAGPWLPGTEEPRASWSTDGEPWSVTWAPGGDRLAWQTPAQEREEGYPVYVRAYPDGESAIRFSAADFTPSLSELQFSPDGRWLAATGTVAGDAWLPGVAIWDAASGEPVAVLAGIVGAVFAPDGEHLLAVRPGGMVINAGVDDEILVWRIGEPEPTHAISAFPPDEDNPGPRRVERLGVSPNGRFLVAVSNRGEIRLWAAESIEGSARR